MSTSDFGITSLQDCSGLKAEMTYRKVQEGNGRKTVRMSSHVARDRTESSVPDTHSPAAPRDALRPCVILNSASKVAAAVKI